MALPPIEPGESPLEYLRRVGAAQQAGTVQPRRYPVIVTATDDKDGGHLPMTGKTAVKRRQQDKADLAAIGRRGQDEALHRALKWTGCWGG